MYDSEYNTHGEKDSMREGYRREERYTREERRKRRRKQVRRRRFVVLCVLIFCCIGVVAGVVTGVRYIIKARQTENVDWKKSNTTEIFKKKIPPIDSAAEAFPELTIETDYLTVNEYSRPGAELEQVNAVVVHYTANPGTSATNTKSYFENLATTGETYASSHFVIGLEGEIVQCIPLNEISYASNERNRDSISIECCHPDTTGEFNVATYNQCVKLVAQLCKYYDLDPHEDVLRHYDVTGKECPLFYVENPNEWEQFLDYVEQYME